MGQFGEIDIQYKNIKKDLSEDIRDLLDVPDFAQVSRNLVSMANFLPLLQPLIDEISPKNICEIGAYRGITTRALSTVSRKYDSELLVVDPAIDPNEAPVQEPHVHYFQMLSEEFLSTPRELEVLFIDGDHNYEVVTKELNLIKQHQSKNGSPILFMHDTGWPCGYRDMYYDTSRVSAVHALAEDSFVSLTSKESTDLEIGLPSNVDFAASAGGKLNGVRTAIEDFQMKNTDWQSIYLPSLYGLGILWNKSDTSSAIQGKLAELDSLFGRLNPFLSILEFNRLLLISEMNQQGQSWYDDQTYISQMNTRVSELSDRVAYLESGKGAFKQFVKRLLRID